MATPMALNNAPSITDREIAEYLRHVDLVSTDFDWDSFHDQTRKICWVCLNSEEDDQSKRKWVKPCKCIVPLKWAHNDCMFRWIDANEITYDLESMQCSVCNCRYIIDYPKMSKLAVLLEKMHGYAQVFNSFIICSAVVGYVYWTAISFGAISFIQFVGFERAFAIFQKEKSLFIIVIFPAVPVLLVTARFIPWEAAVFRFFKKQWDMLVKIKIFNALKRKCAVDAKKEQAEEEFNYRNREMFNEVREHLLYESFLSSITNDMSASRLFCGAIFMPTISCLMGSVLFKPIKSVLYRTLLGGFTYITIKGFFKIYMKYEKYQLQRKRPDVVDYTEENIAKYVNKQQNSQA